MRFLSQHLSTLSGPLNLHASEHRGWGWGEYKRLLPLSQASGYVSPLSP